MSTHLSVCAHWTFVSSLTLLNLHFSFLCSPRLYEKAERKVLSLEEKRVQKKIQKKKNLTPEDIAKTLDPTYQDVLSRGDFYGFTYDDQGSTLQVSVTVRNKFMYL